MSTLYDLLEKYQDHAVSSREKGSYFENLVKAYFENDDVQSRFYDKVWHYADWVEEQGTGSTRQDRGIDLVARLVGTVDQFCAIQCKFYSKDHRLQRSDIDSFFADSNRKPFVRRILIDTTEVPLGKNAQALFEDANQYIESLRIDLNALASSRIDWDIFLHREEVVLHDKKTLRQHQRDALDAVQEGLAKADRGKLIMACGTGKTFTALKIAETMAGAGKRVLFMVPSLALMQQTVTEWSNDTTTPIRAFAACSDAQVGKRKQADDVAELQQHDLAFPATTDSHRLAQVASPEEDTCMTVVFSTYQSIQVISEAQKQHGLPAFDLIICDEAHRTTGVTLAGEDESKFVRIHENSHVESNKRLYMTATPRIYGETAQTRAGEVGAELCSMDDTTKFGQVLFHRGFSWAVEKGLLTDYKVIVLAMDEGLVSRGVQKALSDGDNELQLDDASRIVGCYKALTKASLQNDLSFDAQPMRRALAFCRDIQSSKLIESQFSEVVGEYLETVDEDDESPRLNCEIRHVDGTYNAKSRSQLLEWIKAETDQDECRILTNARCLSEGVDVPALDAIMFLHPRKSQIDVVQSVGRVMRRAEGKSLGYVILPIGVPSGTTPEQALNDNEKYKVVWQILNALRAHDERFDATINKADLGEDISKTIEIIGVHSEELNALTAEVNDLPSRDGKTNNNSNIGGQGSGDNSDQNDQSDQTLGAGVQQGFSFNEEISAAILAKIVKKCGTRDYWEDWAKDIAKIAARHIERIKATLETQPSVRATFDSFLKELRDDLNDSISEDDAIEMLAQHLITRPVFEALFEGNKFTQQNPVSRAIQQVLDALDEHNIEKESQSLEKFYDSVKRRAAGIETAHGKQQLVVQLYDKFFRSAFPRLTQRLGIVYTPVEVVDFIIHSVNDVLQNQFGQTLGSKGVHIIDPFTGTGTFITRLLQSGLIKPEELTYKS
ncbi:DEAD/DEAH box helicase family protein [Halomonas sp. KRD171]|uniref:restriction endonuclease n=1 Tax=Halomonas sp. KRD171 TaxID=2729726 RepID=UPI0019D03FA7|nr:DEAD/DEAH box helicase family protein [Halomonas sp. KRD171]